MNMGGNVEAVLGAGGVISYKVSGDDYSILEGVEAFPIIGDEAPAKDKTTVADTRMVNGAGLTESPDLELAGIHLADDTLQVAFITAAKEHKEVEMKFQWADGTIGIFMYKMRGFSMGETTADGWIKFSVKGSKNSDTAWSKV